MKKTVSVKQIENGKVSTQAGVITVPEGATFYDDNGKTIEGVVKRPITTTWVQGNKYIYTLTFSLNEILFNPSATDWVKVDSDSISIEQ